MRGDRLKRRRQTVQRRIHQQSDRPQRVVVRHQALRARVAEQLASLTIRSVVSTSARNASIPSGRLCMSSRGESITHESYAATDGLRIPFMV
jgi:hypothetical protein